MKGVVHFMLSSLSGPSLSDNNGRLPLTPSLIHTPTVNVNMSTVQPTCLL